MVKRVKKFRITKKLNFFVERNCLTKIKQFLFFCLCIIVLKIYYLNIMKRKSFLIVALFATLLTYSQTTFVFEGNGNWTDTTQWRNGNYPGTTIAAVDTVEILGELTIAAPTIVTNNGTIESFSSSSGTPVITILGGLVNNNMATFSRTQITTQDDGRIIANDPSELVITNNSTLTNLGNITLFGGTIRVTSLVSSIINDGVFSNSGTVEIASGKFENKSETATANIILNNNGVFTVTNGEVINRGTFRNNANSVLSISRTFTTDVDGRIDNSGDITVSGFSSSLINRGNLNNSKDITISDFAALNCTSGSVYTNQNDSTLTIATNCTLTNTADDFSVRGGKLTNNGTFENQTSIFIIAVGEIENNGTMNNSFGAQINNLGTLSGINTEHSGNFSSDGIIAPGNSSDATGSYKLNGFFTSYTQTTSGSLNIDLGGTTAGDTYDQLIVDRDATLDGVLNVNLVDGFEPSLGDSFTILDQGRNISGTFATENLPNLPTGLAWDTVEYGSEGVVLSVIASLSTIDFDKDKQVALYPNPATDKIFISGIVKSKEVSIYNLGGQEIVNTKLSNVNSGIQIDKLIPGIYVVKIDNVVFKLVKD